MSSPATNSKNGRVKSDAVFIYAQIGNDFTAEYTGAGFIDGHIIGTFTSPDTADLIYHCRADNGHLEAGTAAAKLTINADGLIGIFMDWQWLNGDKSAGQSHYMEIKT